MLVWQLDSVKFKCAGEQWDQARSLMEIMVVQVQVEISELIHEQDK